MVAGVVEVVVVVVRATVVGVAVEPVVADLSPPPSQAGAIKNAVVSRNRVLGRIAQIYQVRDGVRSRPEGA